ncbi:hypothetical protein VP01_3131g3 [Puccinia sorghi]|uniref:Uncharacterized protein n=1 Tax=Puccinia sorghi TaxID=27349 RepID=A0A0L6UZ34_9BASI|nr:hypothetical protein VP01_3131g3 [Puccinia sorghi]
MWCWRRMCLFDWVWRGMTRTIPLKRFSTQIHLAHRIASSFKPGPFKGALLSREPTQHEPAKQTTIQHDYSPSQLLSRPSSSSEINATSNPSRLHFPHSQVIKQHLEELLYPLSFSEQLACRIVSAKNLVKSQDSLDMLQRQTEGGVGYARLGEHNTKLSFMGRRTMHFALANFLLHAPRPPPTSNQNQNHPPPSPMSGKPTAEIIENALLTKFVLGQYVGHQWELENIMRWRELAPPVSPPDQHSPKSNLHGTGLWTARGHVVEAIVGAVMAQHGTRLSIAVFNSLVLPHLSFRLEPALLPAIKALQMHDQELENPSAGRVHWDSLDISPFIDSHLDPSSSSSSPASSVNQNQNRPVPVAAVG